MSNAANFHSWWGRQSIEPARTDFWQLGPLQLWIQHLTNQWRISWSHGPDWLDSRVRIVPGAQGEHPPNEAQRTHCIFGSHSRHDLIFAPSLLDRSLISRFETPVQILPNETSQVYVVSPLRVRIEMADNSKTVHELPVFRLSDTWFGPLTGAGELAYSSSGSAFLDLREVPLRLHCAISAITIRNSGRDPLRLERINVPLPRLSLFYSQRTGFWTDSFSLERTDDTEMAALRIDRQPPQEAQPSQFVSGPRISVQDSRPMIRAFGSLFRRQQGAST